MPCPVCSLPSAPNAPPNDPRCGPCHNFRLVAFEDPYAVIIREDRDHFIRRLESEIRAANNLETYQPWLDALKHVAASRYKAWIHRAEPAGKLTAEQFWRELDQAEASHKRGTIDTTQLVTEACLLGWRWHRDHGGGLPGRPRVK